ncbi:response regulator [Polyangium sp. y55x31]|uniref:response regulator transcription factor n=1 Tax=Polyangium sp. y55x31 TaxID=3042688 RepID=UPI0024821E15|nr:response regulator [Polyangium sp. y55x31]MDI1480754.1 response regulator [Polyangium sp. y55x31]
MRASARELIAVVDDDPGILKSLSSLLRSAGFRVATFGSAEAFLASAERDEAHCLILDLEMDGMGGLALLAQLGKPLTIPTVVLTARQNEELRTRALDAGAHAFLLKPPVAAVLFDTIAEAVARATP